MNKNELIAAVAGDANMTQGEAGRAVDSVFNTITSALSRGDEVRVAGFGVFLVANRAARMGRNPKTGQPIQVPASKAARFRPAKSLKDSVNR